jgi:hypothetical protein
LLVRSGPGHDPTELRTGSFKALAGGSQVRLIIADASSGLLKGSLLKVGKTRYFVARELPRLTQSKLPRALHKRKAFGLNSRVFTIYGCLSLGH